MDTETTVQKPVTPPEEVYNRPSSSLIWIFLVVFIALIVGVFIWYMTRGDRNSGSQTNANVIVVKNVAELHALVQAGDVFLMAYSATCMHCTEALPEFEAAAADCSKLTFVKVDAAATSDIAKKLKLTYVPYFCRFQNFDKWTEYSGERTRAAISEHLRTL